MTTPYKEIAKAFGQGGSSATEGANNNNQTPPTEPSLAEKLGATPISQQELQALAMQAVAMQSETNGFAAGVQAEHAKQAETKKPKSIQEIAQAVLLDLVASPDTTVSAEDLLKLAQSPAERALDSAAKATTNIAGRIGRAALGYVIENLPENVKTKLNRK